MATPRTTNSTVSVSTLDPDHYAIFTRALLNVLSTQLAEFTMAQLVDGLPTIDVYREGYSRRNLGGNPLLPHESLCEGAMERTRAFRAEFDPSVLQFKTSLVQAFQNADLGSRQFDLRLIEMVATAIHAIAVYLFNLEEKSHKGDIQSVVTYVEPDETYEWMPGKWTTREALPAFASIFSHACYTFHEKYPNGAADMAGYWAEDRIFGGVILFDRGKSGTECKDVYIHSGRVRWTVRIWRPLETQFKQMIHFLKVGPPAAQCPFPLYADKKVRHRYDGYDAMAWHNIYRDPWERVLPPQKNWDAIRRNTFDYPELQEQIFDKISHGPFYTITRNGNTFLDVRNLDERNKQDNAGAASNPREQGEEQPCETICKAGRKVDEPQGEEPEAAEVQVTKPEAAKIVDESIEADGSRTKEYKSTISGAENPLLIDPSAHEILTNKSETAALEIALPQLKDDPVSTPAVIDSGTKGKEVGTVETDTVGPTKPTLTKSGIKENIAVNEPRDNGQVKGEAKRRHFIKDQDTSQ